MKALWKPPAAMDTKGDRADVGTLDADALLGVEVPLVSRMCRMRVGMSASRLCPSPSRPCDPSPKLYTSPTSVSSKLCRRPAATCTTLCRPFPCCTSPLSSPAAAAAASAAAGTCTSCGVSLSARSLSPSCPSTPHPKLQARPSADTMRVCPPPHATWVMVAVVIMPGWGRGSDTGTGARWSAYKGPLARFFSVQSYPQVNSRPSFVRAAVLKSPQLMPTHSSTTPTPTLPSPAPPSVREPNLSMCVGLVRSTLSPSPSLPHAPSPKLSTRPRLPSTNTE
mmetsp:Transcript_9224/g.22639  ORF Transcript_9224/g.22639 Transcript_9224/m.22639 type:complete len:280 (-) Transcript_9224:720-1559(-)